METGQFFLWSKKEKNKITLKLEYISFVFFLADPGKSKIGGTNFLCEEMHFDFYEGGQNESCIFFFFFHECWKKMNSC